jgi:DNA repair protein RadC
MPATLREVPAAERPRERLALRGAAGLTTAELLALVWGSGTAGRSAVDLASTVLGELGGLSAVAAASAAELLGIPGRGPARAAQVDAEFKLGGRMNANRTNENKHLGNQPEEREQQ